LRLNIGKDVRAMVKRLILLLLLAALISTASEAVTIRRGKKGRKYLRRLSLVDNLRNDKLRIYEEYGYPVHRVRVRGYGTVKEYWRYLEIGVEFVFDEDSNLIKRNRFWPENRRERFEY
jgi:hypothetical protein